MKLIERLKACAAKWCAGNDPKWCATAERKSLARLSSIVANDGKFFTRLEQPRVSVTTATLEKFGNFFGLAEHWPGGDVPDEVLDFRHALGLGNEIASPSSGKNDGISHASSAQAQLPHAEMGAV